MSVPTIPERILQPVFADYLEVMTRAVFQAGVSWAMIAQRWNGFREAFDNFGVERVAAYTEGDIDRLLSEERIFRSEKKIRATVQNAQTLCALDREHGGFANYLRSFPDYAAFEKDFRKRFKFMGPMNVWYFRFRVGEEVPPFEPWLATIQGDHPRMREMVELARSNATYTE